MLNYCKGNEFDMHKKYATYFHLNGCALGLALKPRHTATRKWAIQCPFVYTCYCLFAGKYCIFKKGDCPKGLDDGFVYWDDEDNKNRNKKGGTLPDGKYDRNTLIRYCCRTDGDKRTPVTLPVSSPFYLMAFNSSECQRVKGAIATEEFIRFDNEDYKNKDSEEGSYPYGAGIANHKIYYCHYESKYDRFFVFSFNGPQIPTNI